jgi:hypothetical protein
MTRWNKANVPHKGWKYLGMEDLGENLEPDDVIKYEQCEMCGNERIRYVHILEHPDYYGEIRVGCVCASKMIEDYVNPREKERELKNRVNRKKNFMKQEWRYKPSTGNYSLRYKGDYITIIKSKFNSGWGVIFKGKCQWDYNGRMITDLNTAKIVAFNLFDELHESKEQVQPYWDGYRWIYY